MTESRISLLIPQRDREEIEHMQLEKLNDLLKRERKRKGFYRCLPEHLEKLQELRTLPFTTEEDLAASVAGMLLCSQGDIQRVLSDATSGTTGAAKRVFYTEHDCEQTIRFFSAGLGELIFPGSVTMICFPFSGPRGLGELIASAVERLGARPLRLGSGLSYGEYRQVLEAEKPDSLVGMPVQLLSMLRGKKSLKRALVSGDSCSEAVIRSAEAILGTRLFPHYGSREMGLGGAITCPAHEGMHLRENHVIAEIIDDSGRTLPHGEEGELVITTIGMEAMPLIRYRTGDRTRILPGNCPCGSPVLRLDQIRRQETEEIRQLDEMLFSLPSVVDYRAERTGEQLRLEILYTGEPPSLPRQTEVQLRRVRAEDRSLYPGKRRIITTWQNE